MKMIGRKVRLVKCVAPFHKITILGKVDHLLLRDNGSYYLEKLDLNVNLKWIEFVDEDAEDCIMEINEKINFNPFGIIVDVYMSESENSVTVTEKDSVKNLELLPEDAKLLRTIEGTDWNDCMRQHHELMMWELYKPLEE